MDNIRAGTIAAAIYNTNRKHRSDKLFKWTDFFVDLCDSSKPARVSMSAEDIYAGFKMMFGGHKHDA